MGAASFDARTYEQVEAYSSSTGSAMLVVLIASVAAAVGLGSADAIEIVGGTFAAFLTWMVWIGLTLVIGKWIMPDPGTQTDFGEILRTTGFSAPPGVFRIFAAFQELGRRSSWALRFGCCSLSWFPSARLWITGASIVPSPCASVVPLLPSLVRTRIGCLSHRAYRRSPKSSLWFACARRSAAGQDVRCHFLRQLFRFRVPVLQEKRLYPPIPKDRGLGTSDISEQRPQHQRSVPRCNIPNCTAPALSPFHSFSCECSFQAVFSDS
jgi:hypothetical protein